MPISRSGTETAKAMGRRRLLVAALAAAVAGVAGGATKSGPDGPEQLTVLLSRAFTAAFRELQPAFERSTGIRLHIESGPSMGSAPTALPARLSRNEPADVVIMARESLDRMVESGKVGAASVRDLARSRIAVAVQQGATVPDIRTVEALKRAFLAAGSVGYSDSASGVYISTQLFQRLGIEAQMKAKSHMVPVTPVGEAIAAGKVELGMQQLSELKPIKGIHIVGLLPEEVQKVTTFSAGVVAYSNYRDAAAELISFLASRSAYRTIRSSGMEPPQDSSR